MVQIEATTEELPAGAIPMLKRSYVMGFFGERGSGKSAVMTLYAINLWKERREVGQNLQVYFYPEDYAPNIPGAIAMNPAKLANMPEQLQDSLVLIDEMQEILSKYRSNSTLTQLLMAFFRQVRKRGANVLFTSNDPQNINRQLADQTDFHAHCKMYEAARCKAQNYHAWRTCACNVRLRIKDTQGRHGLNPYKRDGRKGFVQSVVGISQVFPHYNHESIASPMEVMQQDKAALKAAAPVKDLNGLTWQEFDEQMFMNVIPALVEEGYSSMSPAGFAMMLRRDLNIKIDSIQLGKRMSGYGLPKKHTKKGSVYSFPGNGSVTDWQNGIWDPADDEE